MALSPDLMNALGSDGKPLLSVDKFKIFFNEKYKDQIRRVYSTYPDTKNLLIDFISLDEFDTILADLLIEKPEDILKAAKKAFYDFDITNTNACADITIQFYNLPPRHHINSILEIGSKHIGKFISFEGLIKRRDSKHPHIINAMFECKSCMRLHEIPQKSLMINEPAFCNDCGGRSFRLLQEESEFRDFQNIIIQDTFDKVTGDNPESISLILDENLVDTVRPGDYVRITGTLKTARNDKTKKFNNFVNVNHIQHLTKSFDDVEIEDEDVKEIKELSQKDGIFDMLSSSVAPSIKGYKEVKDAMVLQLFEGTPDKVVSDGNILRHNIHLCIIGDPGIGKSKMLTYVSKFAPQGYCTEGTGASGVGLTAAAVKDPDGNWNLEAGALVLADKGFLAIDEFDKMGKDDIKYLHEALEKQTITIDKAGIHATLPARVSVLAAANPKLGRFDRYKNIADQIKIAGGPLLSRFDLIFAIEDRPNEDEVKELSRHILKTHQTLMVKQDIDKELFKKYIAYAKQNIKPVLSDEAIDTIDNFFVNMKLEGIRDDESAVSITNRQLEALVRLSEASAKAHLRDTVLIGDAKRAINITLYSLRQVGFDPETGKIDIDRVEGRTSQSQRNKLTKVESILNELVEDYGVLPDWKIQVEEVCSQLGVDEDRAKSLIRDVKKLKGI